MIERTPRVDTQLLPHCLGWQTIAIHSELLVWVDLLCTFLTNHFCFMAVCFFGLQSMGEAFGVVLNLLLNVKYL